MWLFVLEPQRDIAECLALSYDSWLLVPLKPTDFMLSVRPARDKSNDHLDLCGD
jgi:hypothetical protein